MHKFHSYKQRWLLCGRRTGPEWGVYNPVIYNDNTYIPYHTILKARVLFCSRFGGKSRWSTRVSGLPSTIVFSLAASVVWSFGAMAVRHKWRGHNCATNERYVFLNLTVLARKIVFQRCVRFASSRRAFYFYRLRL